jgi:hypothetical protein
VYAAYMLERDRITVGTGATTAPLRFSGDDAERISIDYSKSARQGAALKTVAGWGTSITTTSSSLDRIVIGDPSINTNTTTSTQSRRSGSTLENFQYTLNFNKTENDSTSFTQIYGQGGLVDSVNGDVAASSVSLYYYNGQYFGPSGGGPVPGYGGGARSGSAGVGGTGLAVILVNDTSPIVFSTSGQTSWVVTEAITSVTLAAYGAGGNGAFQSPLFRSGGGGAYAAISSISVTAGQTIYINVDNTGGFGTWINLNANTVPADTSAGVLARSAIGRFAGQADSSIGVVVFSGGDGVSRLASHAGGGGSAGPDGPGASSGFTFRGGGANGGFSGDLNGWNGPTSLIRFSFRVDDARRFSTTTRYRDTIEVQDLNSIFKTVAIDAKAGSLYSIDVKTREQTSGNTQSSVSVIVAPRDRDRLGIIDLFAAEWAVSRSPEETVIMGSPLLFRTPNNLERISFLIAKFLGDDSTTMLDSTDIGDNLTYVGILREFDSLVIGLPDNRRVSDSDIERVSFNYVKDARQGSSSKTVVAWGTSITTTSSSSDRIVIGDPSINTNTTTSTQSRRSGATLENFRYNAELFKQHSTVLQDTNRLFNIARKFDAVDFYDDGSIFKTVNLTAKAGSFYNITRKTRDGLADAQSSVLVGVGAQQPDQLGVFDAYLAEFYTNRFVEDSITIGGVFNTRHPASNLERVSFIVTKLLGDEQPMLDLVGVFDGLIYASVMRQFDAVSIGLPNTRRVSDSDIERVSFDYIKDARQGAALKTVAGWGTSITTTSSSSDRIVIGDPSISPEGRQSRRSGATLENVRFDYFKPADNLSSTTVVMGSGLDQRQTTAENIKFTVVKRPDTDVPNLVEIVDLNTIFKELKLDAKAGAQYTIDVKTREQTSGNTQSSVSVTIAPRDRDRFGVIDLFTLEWYAERPFATDAVTVGGVFNTRHPASNLERVAFLITKFLGDDSTVLLDSADLGDNFTYSGIIREFDSLVIGLPNNRRVSDSDQERVGFDLIKDARQGAALKTVAGWGTSITTTTSSLDRIVIGDPSISPEGRQSRRSGASLENFRYTVGLLADNLTSTTVTFDDSFRRVAQFKPRYQESQEMLDDLAKTLRVFRETFDDTTIGDEIGVSKLRSEYVNDTFGETDPFGYFVSFIDRGTVRMNNYASTDYFGEDFIGESRILGNFYYPPFKVDEFELILISDDVVVIPGTTRSFDERFEDLDPFGNINTLISRGTLRITNYVDDIDYFASDYIGETRIIS